MGRVSRRSMNKGLQTELEEQLTFIISSLTNKDEVGLFLNEFLTKEEKIMLGKRLILYMLLLKGLTSKQIHASLAMSFDTIRWYKEMFDTKPDVFRKIVEKMLKRERNKELLEKIEKILEPFALALDARVDMRSRARLASGDFWKRD